MQLTFGSTYAGLKLRRKGEYTKIS